MTTDKMEKRFQLISQRYAHVRAHTHTSKIEKEKTNKII